MKLACLRSGVWLCCAAGALLCAIAPSSLVNILTGSGGASAWWRHAAFGAAGLRILGLQLGCILTWWWTMVAAARLCRDSVSHRAFRTSHLRDQRGTAIIEFALLFPVATLLFLVIIQSSFLYTAN